MNLIDIDRLIDEAAHSLTAGEPSAAFRMNVIERLGAARRVPMLLVPAAAAAIVIVAFWIASDRRSAGVSSPPPIASLRPDVPLRSAEAFALRAPLRSADASALHRPPRSAKALALRSAPRYAIDAAPLSELDPAPLAVPSIAMGRMDNGGPIQLAPLETIAPLAIPRLDDSQGDRR